MRHALILCAAALLGLVSMSGCSSDKTVILPPPTVSVRFEGLDPPTITPSSGRIFIDNGDKTTEVSIAGEKIPVTANVRLHGGMLVTAGVSNVVVKVGPRMEVEIPALASVYISDTYAVELDALIPRQIRVVHARSVVVKVACSLSAVECDQVVGFAASRVYARKCKNVSVNTFASATAVECTEVSGEDSTSVTASHCATVVGKGHCKVKAEDCNVVIGKGQSRINAKRCKKVTLLDGATKANFLGF